MYSTTTKKLLSLLTAFAMVFSMIAVVRPMQASAATVETPISNGDFENGAFGGAVAGSNGASIVEKATRTGNYAVKFDAKYSSANNEMLTMTVQLTEAVAAETSFTLSFWAKVASGSTGNAVHFDTHCTTISWGNRVSSSGEKYPVPGGDWLEITKTITAPAGSQIIQVQFYLNSENTVATLDDISLTDANGTELLSTGGFENGALTGIFNANDALEIICTPVHGGKYAAHADLTSGKGMITTTVYLEPSTEARTMSLSYWLYIAPTATANGAHNSVICFDTSSGSWTNLSTKSGAQYASYGVWTQKTLEVAVAANTNTLQIQLYAQDTGADFYIDDLKLTEEVTQVNHDVTLTLNQVTGDGTWQFSISEAPANEYYKVSATIDGVESNFLMGESGGIMCVYPNFFTALGGAVPTSQIVIEAGTVLKAADPNNGWNEIEGADTYTLTEAIDLSYVNGTWSKTVYTTDVTLSLNQVTGDGTWQFSISEAPENKYYKVPATIDGVESNFLMGESGGIMCVYPNFFTALGGAVPTGSIIIAEGAALKAVDPNNGWSEIEGATVLAVSEKIDLSYVDGVWGVTVPNQDAAIEFGSVQNDGTWQFILGATPANKYYKVPAIIDGTACSFLMGESGGIMCVYPNFFTVGGSVPTESLVIEAGAVLKPVDANNGWAVISGAETITLTNTLTIENVLGSWKDMSQYADVTFEEITADDLIVYKWEDQAESNYRSVLGIYAPDAQFGNDAGWGNFTKVAGKVLIDGAEVSVVYGMAPDANGDSSWGANNAILLYITGEGYWDAVTTASSVTICAGTMLVSGVDNTKGVKFAEDFTMYKNCDGSWDTNADTHIYNQQNTELEGALATAATCQSAATYYYSCACGRLGSETFSAGELGDHNYVNGNCSACGQAAQSITISFQTVSADGTWQLIPSAAPADTYYKAPVIIDGKEYNVLIQYGSNLLLIYPSFFTALNGAVPAESFVIPAGTALKAVDSANGWAEIEDAAVLLVTEELKIEKIAGKWVEMSKYADVEFKEIYAADLDLYYQNIMRLGDYSAAEIAIAKLQYPEIADLIEQYGDDANMTTFGIKSTIPTLQIPNDANWATFQLLGTISVNGASPVETYVMQTPDSSDDAETAMDSGFLVRFYNGFVADVAASVTIEPGTRIVTKDGTAGFVFVDGYTIYRDENGNWSDTVPAGTNPVNKWGLILGDNIGVQFQMNVNPEDVVTFTVNGNAVSAAQNNNTYTINLAATQMTDKIVVYINGVAHDKTYSVRDYADIILAGTYGDATKKLVSNMLVYGGAAQTAFGYNTGNLASDGYEPAAEVPTENVEILVSDNISGFAFYGASLLHKDKIAVRFYFRGDVSGLTFYIGEQECQVQGKGDLHYIEVADINPQDIGNTIEVSVTNGNESLTVGYSPLTYIIRMYNKADSSAETKALVRALYGYYLAAAEYAA